MTPRDEPAAEQAAPEADWEALECTSLTHSDGRGGIAMVYSYTQIIQYLRCPRSYRYRYLDGWREKETGSDGLRSLL